MKDVFTHLYYGNICESGRLVKELYETEEYIKMEECYEKMYATFSEEQKKLFEEYSEWHTGYIGLEKERTYANGVKTGMCMALELIDFDPTARE